MSEPTTPTKKAKAIRSEQAPTTPDTAAPSIGEGDRDSDRKYRSDVSDFMSSDDPEKRAREALADLERDPAGFADAERAGKSRVAEEDPEIRVPIPSEHDKDKQRPL